VPGTRFALVAGAALACAALTGCPQERPGAERQIPHERVPPAVSVDLLTADGGAGPVGDAGGAAPRKP
jgi:hypothetical protein